MRRQIIYNLKWSEMMIVIILKSIMMSPNKHLRFHTRRTLSFHALTHSLLTELTMQRLGCVRPYLVFLWAFLDQIGIGPWPSNKLSILWGPSSSVCASWQAIDIRAVSHPVWPVVSTSKSSSPRTASAIGGWMRVWQMSGREVSMASIEVAVVTIFSANWAKQI